MSVYVFRDCIIAVALQAGPGQPSVPDPATDAFRVDEVTFEMATAQEENTEVGGSIDQGESYTGGTSIDLRLTVKMAGSGTPEVAPRWAERLMPIAGWAEIANGAAIPVAVGDVVEGSTTSATLDAAASATAQAYQGMPLVISGGVAMANGTYCIANYTAGKVATLAQLAGAAITNASKWQIPKHTLWRPVSDQVYATVYVWRAGRLRKFHDVTGGWQLALASGKTWKLTLAGKGLWDGHQDVTQPDPPVLAEPSAPVWIGGEALFNRQRLRLSTLNVDSGMTPELPDDPNAQEGYAEPVLTARKITATLDPLMTLLLNRDPVAEMRSGAKGILLAQTGSVAGNRWYVMGPAGKYTRVSENNKNGLVGENLTLHLTGYDSGAFICLY